MSDSLMPASPPNTPERVPGHYTAPALTVLGPWQTVTLLISAPLGDVSGTALLSTPLQEFRRSL
ncbi:hypothetical protein MF271_12640 [Deinococcus sp. KNUC1210]|uniref:hypothetical protein n=1 Tax=Deinococcus sp. KNUC1210 TaxID=2917691 RepID=UPI001EF0CCF2|nr:hypothetical protein [Deinococcus sp. KNUC1210]ULH14823.1 hypothetical protein MF271_12640 [Deinococcus sp. KNUC1210]